MAQGLPALRGIEVDSKPCKYFSVAAAEALGSGPVQHLPYTLKIVLENLLRQQSEGAALEQEIRAILMWPERRCAELEFMFKPARVLMPDSTGIPFLGDMAAMRDAMLRMGGDPSSINPAVPVDFVVDHSIMTDAYGTPQALAHNMALEFSQNRERYEFLGWGSGTFDNLRVIPPGRGICHQINLEYLARIVTTRKSGDGAYLAYPDSLVGMDSHTPMVNALGIVGWGVGGLEGATAALGEPVSLFLQEIVGCRLSGQLPHGTTSTDLVLMITEALRRQKVVGSTIEYFGPALDYIALPERATIANMTPEFGATMGFFPVDAETLRFLESTGRGEQVGLVRAYCETQGLWRDAATPVPSYNRIIEVDLGATRRSVSGPSYPHQRLALEDAPQSFAAAYPPSDVPPAISTNDHTPKNGDIVIAAITSCTNTSNPSVMISAGLLARNACARGLETKPWVKTSLSPGSRVVVDYLMRSGLQKSLDQLGFNLTGLGCMTCMGNSGPLPLRLAEAIERDDIAAVAVLSGNRNFEGRIHPSIRANYLASPPLVVAFALVGSISHDFENEPLGRDNAGNPVYLRDIWPDPKEMHSIARGVLTPDLFRLHYNNVSEGPPEWQALPKSGNPLYAWNPSSSFILSPPFFLDMSVVRPPTRDIKGARMLAMFGDMVTTDHISPIGTITPKSPAGQYLHSIGITTEDFVNYGARRLNHDVMMRGTFANIRIRNEMTPGIEGSSTIHANTGERMSIFDASERYRNDGVPLIVVAGANYGAGSSRDWAAKGPGLLGVRAVLAESFERIHRSNLAGMGILPLEFERGTTRHNLGLDGSELFDFNDLAMLSMESRTIECKITRANGRRDSIKLLARLDTPREFEYFFHGGILQFALRGRL